VTQPKTEAELLALPVGGEFGSEMRQTPDWTVYRVPIAPRMESVFYEPDTVTFARDAEDQVWQLGCQDGQLCRYRKGDHRV